MSALHGRLLAAVGCIALTALSACAVEGVGVDGAVDVGYSGGYYEPYGYDYGEWGPGYYVGPGRGGDHRFDHGGWHGGGDHGGGGRPAYRPAPQDRPMPSMPGRSRGGGGGGHR